MNEYELLFCWGPLAIGAGLPVLYVLGRLHNATRRAALEDAKKDARERALAIREAAALRAKELHEAKVAKENNLVVLQDAKLELELLKIQAAKRKLGINDQPFVANDYPPPVSDAKQPGPN